jgi:hypothetical protein
MENNNAINEKTNSLIFAGAMPPDTQCYIIVPISSYFDSNILRREACSLTLTSTLSCYTYTIDYPLLLRLTSPYLFPYPSQSFISSFFPSLRNYSDFSSCLSFSPSNFHLMQTSKYPLSKLGFNKLNLKNCEEDDSSSVDNLPTVQKGDFVIPTYRIEKWYLPRKKDAEGHFKYDSEGSFPSF